MFLCVEFPYYIVRFKRYLPLFIFSRRSRFHTTQYDLNSALSRFVMKNPKSFHTTQYDLNEKMEYIIGEGTPSFHTTQYDLNYQHFFICDEVYWFPYYIVRFKRYEVDRKDFMRWRFHTTQYDLNIIEIVCKLGGGFGFHTTQYDLNRNYKPFLFHYNSVSILHSTI